MIKPVEIIFFNRVRFCVFLAMLLLVSPTTQGQQTDAQSIATHWARWRGPAGNGIAKDQKPVVSWSATENVIWRTKVPGKGHASPIVTDSQIFLATADEQARTQSVVAYDRLSGQQTWQTVVNTGNFPKEIHSKNTHASSTIALGDGLIYAVFYSSDRKHLAALRLTGEIVWKVQLDRYSSPYAFGIGASPIVYKNLVIVSNDNTNQGALVAMDAKTGHEVWRTSRPSINYSTPVVANLQGKDQLLLSGLERVASYDPLTGNENWRVPAKWKVTCGTLVWNDSVVFASGGYPVPQTIAVDANSSRKLWEKPIKCYEQSMIVVDGFLYALTDRGVIFCFEALSGEVKWKHRFTGPVSASPVLANGLIYFTAENGKTIVVKANPQRFEAVASNQLGNRAFASLALSDNQIFTRVGEAAGESYQEWLYCIGEK